MSEGHDRKFDESIQFGRLFGAIPALLDNLPAGFAIMQVLLDEDGNPYDFVYKYANNVYAYLEDVSLNDLKERTWGHLFPDAGEKLLGAFANIALNGGSRIIEELDRSRKKKIQTICYQPVYGFCACVVQELDIPDAVDIPVGELTAPEATMPEEPSAVAEAAQPEVQFEAETAPQAEIPPMAALHEETQTLPIEEPQPEGGIIQEEEQQAVIPPLAALQKEEAQAVIPPMAALQEAEPEVRPIEVEIPQPEVKSVEAEMPQPEVRPIEAEIPQPEARPIEVEIPKPEARPIEAEIPQPEVRPIEAEMPQPEVRPVEVEIPKPEEQPSEEAAGELAMFTDADMEETAGDVQMVEAEITEAEEAVEMFEPIAPAETAAAFTAVDEFAEPAAVEQDIEQGLASLERLGDVPAEAQPAEPQEASDGSSVSIMDILESLKNQDNAREEAAGAQGDTYDASGQNVSIADIASAAGQQGAAPVGQLQAAPQAMQAQIPQAEVPQAAQAQIPQAETPQPGQAQAVQAEAPQAAPQQESAGEPGNINLEIPEEKSFGGHIAEVISDLNHLDDFSAIMKLEDLVQAAQPEQTDSVIKAKQMIECSMFEEAKDLLRTLL